jgi:prevent-host-death family protein
MIRLDRPDDYDQNGHMKTVTVTQAKAGLSGLLRRVQRGETIVILHRGKPIARLAPAVAGHGEGDDARLARLERAGIVRRSAKPPDMTAFLKPSPVKAGPRGGLLDSLLEERDEERREGRR